MLQFNFSFSQLLIWSIFKQVQKALALQCLKLFLFRYQSGTPDNNLLLKRLTQSFRSLKIIKNGSNAMNSYYYWFLKTNFLESLLKRMKHIIAEAVSPANNPIQIPELP